VDIKRLWTTGRQLGESGRSQVRQFRTDLAEQGRLATEQISAVVDELVNRGSRERIEAFREIVRGEVHEQLRTLGSEIKDLLAQSKGVAERVVAALDELGGQRRELDEQLRALDEQLRDLDDQLRETVRDEVHRRLSTLGVATCEDLAGLRRVIRDDLSAFEDRLVRLTAAPGVPREVARDNERRRDDAPSAERGTRRARQRVATQGSPPREGAVVTDPPTT